MRKRWCYYLMNNKVIQILNSIELLSLKQFLFNGTFSCPYVPTEMLTESNTMPYVQQMCVDARIDLLQLK